MTSRKRFSMKCIIFLTIITVALSSCSKLKLIDNQLFGDDSSIIDKIEWMRLYENTPVSEDIAAKIEGRLLTPNDDWFCVNNTWFMQRQFAAMNDKKAIARIIEMFNGWGMKAYEDLGIIDPPNFIFRIGDIEIGYFSGLNENIGIIEGKYYKLPDAFIEYLNPFLPIV